MSKINPKGLDELRAARRKCWYLLGGVFFFSIFVNLLMLTGPLFMLQVYDRVLGSGSNETLTALFLLVALLYFLMAVLDYARGRVLARFGARFQATLDARVFRAELGGAAEGGDRNAAKSGLRDLETIQMVFTSPAMLALFDLPWTPIFIAAIFIFHPLLGWVAVAGGSILIVITLLNNWLTRAKTLKAQTASARAQNFAHEAKLAGGLVTAQGMGANITTRWRRLRDGALDQTLFASDWTGLFSAATKSFRLFLQSALLAVGAWLVLRGELTAGAMISGSILLGRALAPIEQSIGQWPLVQKARAGWNNLATLLGERPSEPELTTLPRPPAKLAVNGLSVAANGSERVLFNVSLQINPGEALAVIGKSGSGKSTLARAILGLHLPLAGEIRLGGAKIDQYRAEDLGLHIGYLPQEVMLITGTIAENIARMSTEPDGEKVVKAAKRANAHDVILSLPHGYDTPIASGQSPLSGGQKQRIALARALYDDPVILVLDEPNSALDGDGSEALNAAIRAFKSSDRAVIIMTHRPMAISECDRLVVLDQGRVRAEGPRDDVLQSMVKNSDSVARVVERSKPA